LAGSRNSSEAISRSHLPIKKTFETLIALLPEEDVMRVCGQSFSLTFQWDVDFLGLFLRLDAGPSHAFLEEPMEDLHQRLRVQVELFWDGAQRDSAPAPSNEKIRSFDYDGKDIAAFDARRKEVIDAAENIRDIDYGGAHRAQKV
jgi:hypothetical protein